MSDDIKADAHLETFMGIDTVLLLVDKNSLDSLLKMQWNELYSCMENSSIRNLRPKQSHRLKRMFDVDCEAEILDWMDTIGEANGNVLEVLSSIPNGEEGLLQLMNFTSPGLWECWEARSYLYLDVALSRTIESRTDLYAQSTWEDLVKRLTNLPENEFAESVCIDWMERRKKLGETLDEKEDPKIIPTYEAHTRNASLLVHAITTWKNDPALIGIVGREHLDAAKWGHGEHNLRAILR